MFSLKNVTIMGLREEFLIENKASKNFSFQIE